MNTKPLAVIITLIACFISCVISIANGVGFAIFVKRFALTALVFMTIGVVITVFINKGFQVDQDETEKQDQEGETQEEPEDFHDENQTSDEK